MFIDLRKAFGSVHHDLLINKLESYGLRNTELDCFQSYLSDSKQVVSIGKETSHYCLITFGVPQGFNFRSLIVCFVYKRSLKGLNSTLNIDVC